MRAVVGEEGEHQYLIHDRDKIFARRLDDSIRALGMEVLRSPVASPKANSICERVIGTIRGPGLKLLATSREPLLAVGEMTYQLPSLSVPHPQQSLAPEALTRYEAVRLFIDRACAAQPCAPQKLDSARPELVTRLLAGCGIIAA